MNRSIIIFLATVGVFMQTLSYGQDIPVKQFDKRGIAIINDFMVAIMNNSGDEMAAAKAALPYIHPSEYDGTGTNLKRDRLEFSFKKAWQNAKFYKVPVSVTRVQRQNITAIGFGATAQAGTAFKVWVAKKDGAGGMPAPLNVFFPADGSSPTVYYYGSL